MDPWNNIFKEKGKVFTVPHPDMREIVSYLKEKRAKRVLDLGCGTGRHLVLFAIDCPSNGRQIPFPRFFFRCCNFYPSNASQQNRKNKIHD